MNNKNRGITLIALIITIIVIIILLSVTLQIAINGGLFKAAGKAVKDTKIARDDEINLSGGRIKIGEKWYNSVDDYINKNPEIEKIEPEDPLEWEWTTNDDGTVTINLYKGTDKEVVVPNYIDDKRVKGVQPKADRTSIWSDELFQEPDEAWLQFGYGMDAGENSITKIVISEGIEFIDGFWLSFKLEEIVLPSTLTDINNAFKGCSSLQKITIPSNVTSIDWYAFVNCTGLQTINIPEGVTSIGDCAFKGCTSLQTITIPNTVSTIGIEAFCNIAENAEITCQFEAKPSDWASNWTNCSNIIWQP